MSQSSSSDANGVPKGDEVATSASQSATSPEKPAPLFTTGHDEQSNVWPSVERRQGQRRTDERRSGEDRRDDERRNDERRANERRGIEAPVDDPDFQREDGAGLWPSLDWRAGDRRADDRRANERRSEERRVRERRTGERRKTERRAGSIWEGQVELDEDIDDVAEAGNYKGGLD